MRTPGWLLLACLAAACGGNFSNDDLEFLNALPVREDLSAKLPETGTSAEGDGPRLLDALAEGSPSPLYADTRRASSNFNAGLDRLLALLESIRALPPTSRAPDLRVWGPWPDAEHPRHEVRFVMRREDTRFDYALQYRPRGADEEAWWSALEGSFLAEGGLRRGEGELRLLVAALRGRGFAQVDFAAYERLDITYQTRVLPLDVRMRFVPVAGAAEVRYSYRELPGGLAEMTFFLADTQVLPGPGREDVAITSRWTREQGGVGRVTVTGGDVAPGVTASQVECWDAAFRVTYLRRSWDPGVVGRLAACPDVSALGP